jgi:hypothetical protein
MPKHWCLVKLDCSPNTRLSVQIRLRDIPAAALDGTNMKKEEVEKEERKRT